MPPKTKAKDEPEAPEAEMEPTNEVELSPNSDAREDAISQRCDDLNAMADVRDIAAESLAGDLRDAMLEQFKHRPKPYSQLTAIEQRDVNAALELSAKTFARKAVNLIAAADRPSVRAKMKKQANDGSKIVVTLEVAGAGDEVVLALHHALGKDVLIVTADASDFSGQRRGPDVEEDQGDLLGFEAGSDAIPNDDSDLAAAPDAEQDEE